MPSLAIMNYISPTIGMVQVAMLIAIFYRLGAIEREQINLDRRILQLERT